jgi:hypothetical protein
MVESIQEYNVLKSNSQFKVCFLIRKGMISNVF